MVVTSPTAPALPGELASREINCPPTVKSASRIRFQLEENG